MRTGSVNKQESERGKRKADWKSPHGWAYIPLLTLVLIGGTSVFLRRWHADDAAHNGGLIFGAIFGVGITCGMFYGISLLIALIARRSRLVLSITLALLASLTTVGNSFVLYRTLTTTSPSNRAKIAARLEQVIQDFKTSSMQRAAMGDATPDAEGMSRYADSIYTLAGELRGSEGDHLLGLAALFDAQSQMWKEYNDSNSQMQLTWPIEAARIRSIDDLTNSRRDLERFRLATEAAVHFLTNTHSWAHGVMSAEGIDLPEAEQAFAKGTLSSDDRIKIQRQIFKLDIDSVRVMLNMCNLLETEWGRWEDNGVFDYTMFETDDGAEQWDKYISDIENLGISQAVLAAKYNELSQQ